MKLSLVLSFGKHLWVLSVGAEHQAMPEEEEMIVFEAQSETQIVADLDDVQVGFRPND